MYGGGGSQRGFQNVLPFIPALMSQAGMFGSRGSQSYGNPYAAQRASTGYSPFAVQRFNRQQPTDYNALSRRMAGLGDQAQATPAVFGGSGGLFGGAFTPLSTPDQPGMLNNPHNATANINNGVYTVTQNNPYHNWAFGGSPVNSQYTTQGSFNTGGYFGTPATLGSLGTGIGPVVPNITNVWEWN